MEIEKSPVCRFHLRPFSLGSAPPGLQVLGSVTRLAGILTIKYTVAGDLDRILLPEPVQSTCRRHELWRRTCFEVFFGVEGQAAYWEGNFAPAGDWNVYHFSSYRERMTEETRVDKVSCRTVRDISQLEVVCSLTTTSLFRDEDVLTVGIGCIILEVGGNVSYWAIEHCGEKPDFHDSRSFVLTLAGVPVRRFVA